MKTDNVHPIRDGIEIEDPDNKTWYVLNYSVKSQQMQLIKDGKTEHIPGLMLTVYFSDRQPSVIQTKDQGVQRSLNIPIPAKITATEFKELLRILPDQIQDFLDGKLKKPEQTIETGDPDDDGEPAG